MTGPGPAGAHSGDDASEGIPPTWHARQAEEDLAGAAVGFWWAAPTVARLLNPDAVYDRTLARVISAAVALTAEPDVDLTPYDNDILGPKSMIVAGLTFVGVEVPRIVAVSTSTEVSLVRIALMVANVPSWPKPSSIAVWAEDVHRAAQVREAYITLTTVERQLLDGDVAPIEVSRALSGVT